MPMKEFNSHPTTGLQLRRAISIQAEGSRLLEKHVIAPLAARLCYTARRREFRFFCLRK
jgi:hypothetical protein